MKAAVCYEFGKPLVVEEVILDPPQHGDACLRLFSGLPFAGLLTSMPPRNWLTCSFHPRTIWKH